MSLRDNNPGLHHDPLRNGSGSILSKTLSLRMCRSTIRVLQIPRVVAPELHAMNCGLEEQKQWPEFER